VKSFLRSCEKGPMYTKAKSDLGYAPRSGGKVIADTLKTSHVAIEEKEVPSRDALRDIIAIGPDMTASENEMIVKDGVEYGGATDIEHDGSTLSAQRLLVGGPAATETSGVNLHVTADSNSKGLVIPTMTTAQREALAVDTGTLVFDTDEKAIYFKSDASSWRTVNERFPPVADGDSADDGLIVSLDDSNTGRRVLRTNPSYYYDESAKTAYWPTIDEVAGQTYAFVTLTPNLASETSSGSPATVTGKMDVNIRFATTSFAKFNNMDDTLALPYPLFYFMKLRMDASQGTGTEETLNVGVNVYRKLNGVDKSYITDMSVDTWMYDSDRAPIIGTQTAAFLSTKTTANELVLYFEYQYTKPPTEPSDLQFHDVEFEIQRMVKI
jgi:hypothetical protein